MKQGIDQAYEMGAVAFGFLAGRYAEETKEEAYQALVQSTKELCAYAAAHGNLKLALEVFDYDLDKRSLIGPAPLAKRFAEEITKSMTTSGSWWISHIPESTDYWIARTLRIHHPRPYGQHGEGSV